MSLTIRQYTADSLEFRFRTGPIWKPCSNFVPAKEAWKYVKPMQELLANSEGSGLAANQVDLDIPLFVIRLGKELQPCYRPRVISESDQWADAPEGCLSFPGAVLMLSRRTWVDVDFIAFSNSKRKRMKLHGREARLFMHEFDHLQGKTIFHHYAKELSPLGVRPQQEEPKSLIITDV